MSKKPTYPIGFGFDQISKQDAEKLSSLVGRMKPGIVQVVEDRMEYRPIVSDAARHIAEKIRQSIKAGEVMAVNVFGRQRITVVLDLEMAREFAKENDSLGGNLEPKGDGNA